MPTWRKREDRDDTAGERTEDRERGGLFDDPFFEMRSGLFRDFDDRFRRMRAYMDAMMEKAASGELRDMREGGPFVYGWSMRVGPDGVPHVQTFGNVKPPALRGGKALPFGDGREAGPQASEPRATEGRLGEDDRRSSGARQGEDDRRSSGSGKREGGWVQVGEGGGGEGEASEPERMAMPGVREPLTDICEGENGITITAEMPGIEKDLIELETGDDFLVIKVEKGSRRFFKEMPLDVKIAPNSARARYNNGVLEITVAKAPAEKKGTKVKVE